MEIYSKAGLKRSVVYILFLCAFLLVLEMFYKFYFEEDYYLHINAECNEFVENCFSYEDDTGEIIYYKRIFIKAYEAPKCDSAGCAEELIDSCAGFQDCFVEYCYNNTGTEDNNLCQE